MGKTLEGDLRQMIDFKEKLGFGKCFECIMLSVAF